VSESSVAKLFHEDRQYDDARSVWGRGGASLFGYGLYPLHAAIHNFAGYSYTYITEQQVLEDSGAALLDQFDAIVMAGFHGEDLGSMEPPTGTDWSGWFEASHCHSTSASCRTWTGPRATPA